MTNFLELFSSEGETISDDLFGGNLLANRGELYGDGQYDTAINDLGITSLRYPGGSRTEKSFDISDPDAETVVDKLTGQVDEWIALSDFFSYAKENGHPVSIVIPTRYNLSTETDANGNRFPDIDVEELRTFIREVVTGKYGDADIQAFEIGNEYWHSGAMNSVEYGRLAAEMTKIIHEEMSTHASEGIDIESINITVQMGHNYGAAKLNDIYTDMDPNDVLADINDTYGMSLGDEALSSSGSVNWGIVQNWLVINELRNAGVMDMVDGVIAHVYSLGLANEWSRVNDLNMVQNTWLHDFPELDVHVTEWNLKGITSVLDRDVDYGLHQAEEMIEIVEEFARVGVDYANVWPLINFTDNALNNGWTYGETNAPGAMFQMMAENLPGKSLLDFNQSSWLATEAEFEDIHVYGFAGEGELVLYVTGSGSDAVNNTNLDLSGLLEGFQDMQISVLGVEAGSELGSNRSAATIEDLNYNEVYVDGLLEVSLGAEEIVQIVVTGVEPTNILAPYVTTGEQFFSPSNIQINVLNGSELDDALAAPTDANAMISGLHGDDFIEGGGGDDFIDGGWGDDLLLGRQGDDSILGQRGDDLMYGGDGSDLIAGGRGNDTIYGSDGADSLVGGTGNDVLYGGAGLDTFFFREDHGLDEVADFSLEDDHLVFSPHLFETGTQASQVVQEYGTETSEGIMLTFTDTDSVLVRGVFNLDALANSIELG